MASQKSGKEKEVESLPETSAVKPAPVVVPESVVEVGDPTGPRTIIYNGLYKKVECGGVSWESGTPQTVSADIAEHVLTNEAFQVTAAAKG